MRDATARRSGFTLIDLMLAVAVLGSLATVAIVNYTAYVEKARIARAIAEIKSISRVIDGLRVGPGGALPDTLPEVDAGDMLDPWGNAYEYLKIEGTLPPGQALADGALPPVAAPPEGQGGGGARPRKDQFLVPLNSDYDLYSKGADGQSKTPLNPPVSRDDVIRALDGAFVGLAEDF